MERWDYIVTQQVSQDGGIIEFYYSYIECIAAYIKDKAPQAEFLLQETWAYEIDSLRSGFNNYSQNQQEMYEKVSAAYRSVAKQIGARLIPCGDVVQELRKKEPFVYEKGGMSICRDGFQMNVIYGRYLLTAVWYKTLLRKNIGSNTYILHIKLTPNAICNEQILEVVKEIVKTVTEDLC